jgi:hypothetical protein
MINRVYESTEIKDGAGRPLVSSYGSGCGVESGFVLWNMLWVGSLRLHDDH